MLQSVLITVFIALATSSLPHFLILMIFFQWTSTNFFSMYSATGVTLHFVSGLNTLTKKALACKQRNDSNGKTKIRQLNISILKYSYLQYILRWKDISNPLLDSILYEFGHSNRKKLSTGWIMVSLKFHSFM